MTIIVRYEYIDSLLCESNDHMNWLIRHDKIIDGTTNARVMS